MGAIESVAGERQLTHGTLTVHVGPEREICLVRLDGELDLDSVPILEHELDRLLSAKLSAVILDLEGLQFIDSSGLQCLVRAARHSQANGHNLEILAPSGDVERIIEVSGIGEVLPMVRWTALTCPGCHFTRANFSFGSLSLCPRCRARGRSVALVEVSKLPRTRATGVPPERGHLVA